MLAVWIVSTPWSRPPAPELRARVSYLDPTKDFDDRTSRKELRL